jgi:hypothetical protein
VDRRGSVTLVLSDGSVWEISDADSAKIAHWIRFSTMEEVEIAGRPVYVLANKSFGTDVGRNSWVCERSWVLRESASAVN